MWPNGEQRYAAVLPFVTLLINDSTHFHPSILPQLLHYSTRFLSLFHPGTLPPFCRNSSQFWYNSTVLPIFCHYSAIVLPLFCSSCWGTRGDSGRWRRAAVRRHTAGPLTRPSRPCQRPSRHGTSRKGLEGYGTGIGCGIAAWLNEAGHSRPPRAGHAAWTAGGTDSACERLRTSRQGLPKPARTLGI